MTKLHTRELKKLLQQSKSNFSKVGINNPFFSKKHTPERFLQSILKTNMIEFTKHRPIRGQPDIFIEPNICIFVDGDYWHNRTDVKLKDKKTNEILLKQNYKIIRIWEHEIYETPLKCLEKIQDAI